MKRSNRFQTIYRYIKINTLVFWRRRQKRERTILFLGLLFLIVLVFFYGVWQPFVNFQYKTITQYTKFQSNLPYIARTLMTYEQLKNSHQIPHASKNVPLKESVSQMLINQQLVPFGVKTSMVNPKLATLSFKEVPFDALMQGVEALSKQAIFVVQAQVHKVNGKGIVQGQLTFSQF